MIPRLFLPRRKFDHDDTAHKINHRALEDWAERVRRNVPEGGADWDNVNTSETRTAATYGDLATVGPTVTVKTGDSGKVLVIVSARIKAGAGGAAGMAFQILDSTGAEVHPAQSDDTVQTDDTANTDTLERSTIVKTLGRNEMHTFRAKYIGNGANASTFTSRRINVIPL